MSKFLPEQILQIPINKPQYNTKPHPDKHFSRVSYVDRFCFIFVRLSGRTLIRLFNTDSRQRAFGRNGITLEGFSRPITLKNTIGSFQLSFNSVRAPSDVPSSNSRWVRTPLISLRSVEFAWEKERFLPLFHVRKNKKNIIYVNKSLPSSLCARIFLFLRASPANPARDYVGHRKGYSPKI